MLQNPGCIVKPTYLEKHGTVIYVERKIIEKYFTIFYAFKMCGYFTHLSVVKWP